MYYTCTKPSPDLPAGEDTCTTWGADRWSEEIRSTKWSDYSNPASPSEFREIAAESSDWGDACKSDCSETDCEAVDPIAERIIQMELRMQQLEDRLVLAEISAATAKKEAADTKAKLQQSEYLINGLMARVSNLEIKGWNDQSKEREQQSRYDDMVRRVTQMEHVQKPYWGQTQITCGGTTPVTSLPSGSDINWRSLTIGGTATTMSAEQAQTVCAGIGAGLTGAGMSYYAMTNNTTTGK